MGGRRGKMADGRELKGREFMMRQWRRDGDN